MDAKILIGIIGVIVAMIVGVITYLRLKNALSQERVNTTIAEPPNPRDIEEISILEFLDRKAKRTPQGIHDNIYIEIPVVNNKLWKLLNEGLVESDGSRWSLTSKGREYKKTLKSRL